jgi:hypothetical protein
MACLDAPWRHDLGFLPLCHLVQPRPILRILCAAPCRGRRKHALWSRSSDVGTVGTIAAMIAVVSPAEQRVIHIGEAFADALYLPRTEVKLETRLRALVN